MVSIGSQYQKPLQMEQPCSHLQIGWSLCDGKQNGHRASRLCLVTNKSCCLGPGEGHYQEAQKDHPHKASVSFLVTQRLRSKSKHLYTEPPWIHLVTEAWKSLTTLLPHSFDLGSHKPHLYSKKRKRKLRKTSHAEQKTHEVDQGLLEGGYTWLVVDPYWGSISVLAPEPAGS